MKTTTTATLLLLSLLACAPEVTDLEAGRTEARSVTVNPGELHLVEGKSAPLEVKISPWNAGEKTVLWTSADEQIATVSEQGRVTAVSPGETDIQAQVGEVSARCHVFVRSWLIPAQSVAFKDRKSLSMSQGTSAGALALDLLPLDCNDQVRWSSADPAILEVHPETGALQALKAGQTQLIAEVSGLQTSIPVLVHGEFWLEPTDALIKPVQFQHLDFTDEVIRVARGESATLQTLIYSDVDQGILSPSVTRFSHEGSEGLSLTPQLWWVEQIKCSEHWDDWAGGRPSDAYSSDENIFPDPLVPVSDKTVSLKAGQQQALWAEFKIPAGFPAGTYVATVEVTGASGKASCDFKVEVYDVDLPPQSMDVIQWIMYGNTHYMNGGVAPTVEEEYDFFYPQIIRLLNDYGTNSWWMMRADFSCNPGYEYVDGIRKVKWNFDEAAYQRDFDLLENNTDRIHTVHGKTFLPWDKKEQKYFIKSPETDEQGNVIVDENGNFHMVNVYFPLKDEQMRANAAARMGDYFYQLQEFLRAHHLKDGRSWLDVYVQNVADEPKDHQAESYTAAVRFIKSYAPDIKFLEPIETDKIGEDAMDYPCPTLKAIDKIRAKGNQVQWMYTCMSPQGDFANRFIRIPLFKTRLVHWVQYKYNAVGYLHWGPAYWMGGGEYSRWFDASGNWTVDACGQFLGGDMWIIWPAYRKVYPSIRLSAMRDGIRDYELLRMVEKISSAKAQELCGKIVTDNAHYELGLDNFKEVRKEMLDFLSNN